MRVEEVVTLCAAYDIEPGNLIRQAIAYATTGSPTTYDPAKTYPPTRFPSTITLDGYSLAAKEWKDRTAEIEGHQEMP